MGSDSTTRTPRPVARVARRTGTGPDPAKPLHQQARTLELMRAMWALDHALHRMSKRMAATVGVTAPQRLVLRVLGRDSTDTAGALARTLHLHPSTLTGVLQRLERDGLIVRHVEPDDKRRSRLTLTRRGAEVSARTSGTVESGIADTLERLPAADAEAAIRVLLEVAATLRQLSSRRESQRTAKQRTAKRRTATRRGATRRGATGRGTKRR